MEELNLTLFGQPSLQNKDSPIELKSRKGWALLAYLALMQNPIPRETLATLLWPEQDATGSRRNLRRLLYTLNQSPIAPYIQADQESIALDWPGKIDVRTFVDSVQAENWAEAVSSYSGELMDGVIIGIATSLRAG